MICSESPPDNKLVDGCPDAPPHHPSHKHTHSSATLFNRPENEVAVFIVCLSAEGWVTASNCLNPAALAANELVRWRRLQSG